MRPLTHAVPGAVRLLLRDAPLSAGKIELAWRVAVGPALGRATSIAFEDHVLIVEASTPEWSREVSRSAPVILERMREFLGADVVSRIEVRRA